MSAPGFVKEPTVVVGEREKAAVLKEYDNNLPDLGLRDQESDQDFVSICKVSLSVILSVQLSLNFVSMILYYRFSQVNNN